jgi:hypothetical protein
LSALKGFSPGRLLIFPSWKKSFPENLFSENVVGISWKKSEDFLGDFLGKVWGFLWEMFGDFLGDFLEVFWGFLGRFFGSFLGNCLETFWEISWEKSGHFSFSEIGFSKPFQKNFPGGVLIEERPRSRPDRSDLTGRLVVIVIKS